jgi:hypothetical protein
MHLTVDETLDLIEGRARESQIMFWTSHAEGCGECQEQLKNWKQLHFSLKNRILEDAPEGLVRNAHAIFQAPTRKWIPALREVIAAVVFDSFAQPALAGARGSAAAARQIVLRAEEFDIHVRISGDSERRHMTGQVLARGEASFVRGAMLHLVRDGKRFESTSVDKLGEFEFQGFPEGLLSLQMDLPHLTIVGALNVS